MILFAKIASSENKLDHMRTAVKTAGGLLLAAAAIAMTAMIHGAGKFEWNGLYPWVIGPYIVLLLIFCLPVHQSRSRSIAGCIAALAVLLFTGLFYIDAMWISISSTSALVFIFAPGYLFIGGLLVWALSWFLLIRQKSEHA
jgi:hypothetical protein